ncbi:MAG: hypothetical protein IPJ77_22415 [Planctomycetes bacterium]|nr:hypothetical protein [Planctomycetota bacterium]
MQTKHVAVAAGFLVVCVAFAVWASTTRSNRSASHEDARGSAAPRQHDADAGAPGESASAPNSSAASTRESQASADPARPPAPAMLANPDGYSIDARPNAIVGHVSKNALEGAARGAYPKIELVHASGRRVAAPVAMTGFFGAGALEDGAWTVRCTTSEFWPEERAVVVGAAAPRAEVELALAPLPRLELTLRTMAGKPSARGVPLPIEPWLVHAARLVATREPPGEVLRGELLGAFPVRQLLPRSKDDIAGGMRTTTIDGPLALPLAPGAWVSFVVEERVVLSKPVDRATSVVAFEIGEPELARALGTLEVRVTDVEHGAPMRGARLTFPGAPEHGGRRYGLPTGVEFAGTALLAHVLAGPLLVLVEAEGREQQLVAVDVRPGERAVVEARLGPETRVRGRIVDEAGKGLAVELELAPLEELESEWSRESVRRFRSDGEGLFQLGGLSAAAWVLRSADDRATFAPLVLDTRSEKGAVQGAIDSLALQAARGVPVTVVRPIRANEGETAGTLRLVDERGLAARERRGRDFLPTTVLRVLPGRYRVQWEDGAGEPRERELVVGAEPVRVELD